MHEKKTYRRKTKKENEQVKHMMADMHDAQEQQQKVAAMASASLFAINANKNDKKREKLRADRFKQQIQAKVSKTERVLVKRLTEKGPAVPIKDSFAGEMDVWSTPDSKGVNAKRFDAFKARSMAKVKAVMTPLGGHSFNPSVSAHKGVLNKVLREEVAEIEKER
jgi:hypothetical protein